MGDENTPRQRIGRLAPLSAVLATIETSVQPVASRSVAPADAVGFVLAADLVAPIDLPRAAIALRDGYALSSEQTLDGNALSPAPLSPSPVPISVGDAMPAESDAVLPYDAVTVRGGMFVALAVATPGEGVLAAKGDCEAGTIIRKHGEPLRPLDLALCRLASVSSVAVRAPRIRTITARRGDPVHEAAAEWLCRALAGEGAIALPYEAGLTIDALTAPGCDAILVVGGTGEGPADASVTLLTRAGRIAAHGIALSPGETAAVGFAGNRPVLFAPGRLDSVIAAFVTLGRHVVARLAGGPVVKPIMTSTLRRKVTSTIGMTEIIPVRCDDAGAEPLASSFLPILALTRADGYIIVPPDSEGFPAGSTVAIYPLP